MLTPESAVHWVTDGSRATGMEASVFRPFSKPYPATRSTAIAAPIKPTRSQGFHPGVTWSSVGLASYLYGRSLGGSISVDRLQRQPPDARERSRDNQVSHACIVLPMVARDSFKTSIPLP